MKRAIIVGATSGIGYEVARLLHNDGYAIGIAGRRTEKLQQLKEELGENVFVQQIDVCEEKASDNLLSLIEMLGGVDLIFLASGIGKQNALLSPEIELATVSTNCLGFTRMIDTAFRYFSENNNGGHIAAISSIAGTKGLGISPAYSATKRFQNTYIQCLAQLAKMNGKKITFTDIRPGFVDTDLLANSGRYPMLMDKTKVAKSIVKAIKSKKRVKIIDWRYQILVFFWKLIPDFIWERLKIKN